MKENESTNSRLKEMSQTIAANWSYYDETHGMEYKAGQPGKQISTGLLTRQVGIIQTKPSLSHRSGKKDGSGIDFNFSKVVRRGTISSRFDETTTLLTKTCCSETHQGINRDAPANTIDLVSQINAFS